MIKSGGTLHSTARHCLTRLGLGDYVSSWSLSMSVDSVLWLLVGAPLSVCWEIRNGWLYPLAAVVPRTCIAGH